MKINITLLLASISISLNAQWFVLDTTNIFQYDGSMYATINYQIISDGSIYYKHLYQTPSQSEPGDSYIVKTDNDCQSWNTILSGSTWNLAVFGISFPNPDTGFISCNQYFNHVLKTIDGGQNWTKIMYSQSDSDSIPHNIVFISGKKGYGFSGNIFYKYENEMFFAYDTLDITMTKIDYLFRENGIGYLAFANDHYNNMHYMIKTLDDGNSWDTIYSDTTISLKQVIFPSDSVGYVICDQGKLLKTTDYGNSWTSFSTDYYRLYAGSFVDNETGYIVCSDGILFTEDGGVSWPIQELPDGFEAYFIQMLDNSTGYVFAQKSIAPGITYKVILKTTNGGLTENGTNEFHASNVYPNPFADELTIEIPTELSEEKSFGCVIYNSAGAIVVNQDVVSNPTGTFIKINTSNFNSGVYFLQLSTKELNFQTKIIKF